MTAPRTHGALLRALIGSLTLALACAFASGGAPAATAAGTATVPTAVSAAAPDLVTVLVTMDHQADLRDVTGTSRRARLRSLVAVLKAAAEQGQRSIATRLGTLASRNRVGEVRPLWIVDAVAVTTTPDVAASLAGRADVRSVVSDEIDLVPAVSTVEPHLTSANVPPVWEDHADTGAGVVVATLDSGADVSHPDLSSTWRGGTNSWFDPYGEHPDAPIDLTGHGTGVLGAAVGGDASGSSIGVAPEAQWIAARVFDDRGTSSAAAVHEAFQWLLDPDGDPATADAPQVVNGSWSIGAGPGCDLSFQPDVQALEAAGILPVFAAGNYGSGADTGASPANYPESLAVGALGSTDTVLASSSRGPSTCGGRSGAFPDLVAPGSDVLTTERYGLYQVLSGTSIAAPQVAGVLALALAAQPGLTPAEQREAVTLGAVDLGDPGPDSVSGYGRVDALATYDLATATTAPPPDFSVSAAPDPVSVVAGEAVSFDVTLVPTSGTPGDAAVSVAAPGGTTAEAVPATVPGADGVSTVTVTTSVDTVPGDHPVVVDVVADGVTHSVSVTLSVTAPPPDFSVSAAPDPVSVVAGEVVSFDVTLVPTSGTPGDAAVSVAAPGGTTAEAVPATVPGADGVSTVTVTTSVDTVPGDHPVVVDVVADGVTHSVSVTLSVTAPPPPPPPDVELELSTTGVADPPGLSGSADDADVLSWDGVAFARTVDASAAPWSLPSKANTDGFSRLDADRFLVSFATNTKVPGLGTVQDEDVLLHDGTGWAVWFDGTAQGLMLSGLDLDALSAVGDELYFSTIGNVRVPGVSGTPDDADVYRWDGTGFTRVWDATAEGLARSADIDGLDVTDEDHLALSFSTTTVAVPGLGTVEDEDVVRYADGAWSTTFDGTAVGLTTDALDVDALDLP
ncbi:S8 family serine peptidase [Nocardioides sp. YIM 152588]|uniref:S8 family serine peptidase n=1 Tax=Nocardioides sp. YIM 152588 TaxID=3158259 RepID=UPI0032E52E9C